LTFDFPIEHPIDLLVNGNHKYSGQVVTTGRKRACLIEKVRLAPSQGRSNDDGSATGGSSASG
jgi:hypothetical protein